MKQLSRRLTDTAITAAMLAGSIMFATSMTTYMSAKELAQPACDGVNPCSNGCGTKCICNVGSDICLDNT